jgi:hypothetical protein
MRFLVQWVASERQGESVISVFLVLEHRRQRAHVHLLLFGCRSVGILAYPPNSRLHRNLMLIETQIRPSATAPYNTRAKRHSASRYQSHWRPGAGELLLRQRACCRLVNCCLQSIAMRMRASLGW